MNQKIVLTEKGYSISHEIFSGNDDQLPPFVGEAKPPFKLPKTVKLEQLLNSSNGFIDRNTLKTADSTRNQNKPYFMPDNSSYLLSSKSNQSKYLGIFPPKTSENSMRPSISQKTNQNNVPSGRQLKLGKPLVLDSDGFTKMTEMHSEAIHRRGSNVMQLSQMQQYMPKEEAMEVLGKQQRSGMLNLKSTFDQSPQITKQPEKQDQSEIKRLKLWATAQLIGMLKGSSPKNNQRNQEVDPKKNIFQKNSQSESYLSSVKNRMEQKKAEYMKARSVQEQKLKELTNHRYNLSKEPVHIAARYLQDLKSQNQTVENLVVDVEFQNKRYKNRLQEYHKLKYQKNWKSVFIPHKREHTTAMKSTDEFNEIDELLSNTNQNDNNKIKQESRTKVSSSMHGIKSYL